MKWVTVFLTFLMMNSAWAHTDHVMGEGNLHALYHAIFWGVFALVVFKGLTWYKASKTKNKQK